MKTLTLATIYEDQGLKEEALNIYKEILKKDPANKEANAALRRISGMRRKFKGVNINMKNYFILMEEKEEFNKFERWLLQGWN